MNTPERRPKPGLFTQFLAACAICLGLMTAAEFAGAYTAEQEVVQQENDNAQHNQAVARLRTDNKLPAAYTESGLLTGNEGEIIITADYHPIEPLHEKTRRHQRRGRDYGLLGGLSLFLLGSVRTADLAANALLRRRRRGEEPAPLDSLLDSFSSQNPNHLKTTWAGDQEWYAKERAALRGEQAKKAHPVPGYRYCNAPTAALIRRARLASERNALVWQALLPPKPQPNIVIDTEPQVTVCGERGTPTHVALPASLFGQKPELASVETAPDYLVDPAEGIAGLRCWAAANRALGTVYFGDTYNYWQHAAKHSKTKPGYQPRHAAAENAYTPQHAAIEDEPDYHPVVCAEAEQLARSPILPVPETERTPIAAPALAAIAA